MTALRSSRPTPRPVKATRPVVPLPQPSSNQRKQQQRHKVLAAEVSVKLLVNVGISVAAIVTLAQLLPYRAAQQTKLEEVQKEVKVTQGRVNQLKAEFKRNFDPHEARNIMQEQTNRIDPNQRVIVWSDTGTDTEKAAQLP